MNNYIFEFLATRLGNEIGAAALMGNLYIESKLQPVYLEGSYSRKFKLTSQEYTDIFDSITEREIDTFCRDGAGYGIAQWTFWSRKKALWACAIKMGKSVGDLDVQLNYLWDELQSYKSVIAALKSATDLRYASDIVALKYEKPSHTEEKYLQNRANWGQKFYDEYANKEEKNLAFKTVAVKDLVDHCMRFYNEHWGYIYGAHGQIWTQKAQNAATDPQTKKYGQQWVGKHVIDCSGVWWLSMQELGSYMYHGSNTMWNKYCVAKGRLNKGKRTDGQELKIGTAIYTGIKDGDHNHVGIYIGDGQVLEAGGCQYGVILTKVTLAKWTCWGEMKYVDYGNTDTKEPESTGNITITYPTLRQGDRGEVVTQLQDFLSNAGSSLKIDGIFGNGTASAVRAFQKKNGLDADGIVGPKTWKKLLEVSGNIKIDKPVEELVDISIPGIKLKDAEELKKKYPKAIITVG